MSVLEEMLYIIALWPNISWFVITLIIVMIRVVRWFVYLQSGVRPKVLQFKQQLIR